MHLSCQRLIQKIPLAPRQNVASKIQGSKSNNAEVLQKQKCIRIYNTPVKDSSLMLITLAAMEHSSVLPLWNQHTAFGSTCS